ncbi:MAG: tRNA (guanosine(37)-N1)-methyltransferase TrmD [Phycisphaerae bacterium]|nr:tRNA (guanosine(37)-N1)-methyltransferase TrmD [Phycisphaerae bacterium]
MKIDVFTLLPEIFGAYLDTSIMGRARQAGHLQVEIHNIRDFATDRHRTTDDEPYGGGGGMIMKPEPIFRAVETVLADDLGQVPVILFTPQGRVFNQSIARELAVVPHMVFLCGRYEGVDERVRQNLATDELSIGDYVLTGGELPALVVIDAVTRLIPGVLGDAQAPEKDSHANGLLEHPHYTRPAEFRSERVPDVLLSGNHALIDGWRREQAIRRTWQRRPELLKRVQLTEHELALIETWEAGQED